MLWQVDGGGGGLNRGSSSAGVQGLLGLWVWVELRRKIQQQQQ